MTANLMKDGGHTFSAVLLVLSAFRGIGRNSLGDSGRGIFGGGETPKSTRFSMHVVNLQT